MIIYFFFIYLGGGPSGGGKCGGLGNVLGGDGNFNFINGFFVLFLDDVLVRGAGTGGFLFFILFDAKPLIGIIEKLGRGAGLGGVFFFIVRGAGTGLWVAPCDCLNVRGAGTGVTRKGV